MDYTRYSRSRIYRSMSDSDSQVVTDEYFCYKCKEFHDTTTELGRTHLVFSCPKLYLYKLFYDVKKDGLEYKTEEILKRLGADR